MLIDCSYFTSGSRHIQNATLGTPTDDDNYSEVDNFIEAYIKEFQEEFLCKMLGDELGRALNVYVSDIPTYALSRRINKALLRGVDGENIRTVEDAEAEAKPEYDAIADRICEPFADYVFFHILRDANTQSTITGLVYLKSANTYSAPMKRQVTTWNSMVAKNRMFAEWCRSDNCPIKGIVIDSELLTTINYFNL